MSQNVFKFRNVDYILELVHNLLVRRLVKDERQYQIIIYCVILTRALGELVRVSG